MVRKFLVVFFLVLGTITAQGGIKITPDMHEYSPNSITGIYLCTPTYVESGDCSDVDPEYYENLALITLGAYEIGLLSVNNIKTIAFKGPLSPGAADNLIRILEAHSGVDTLTLSSQGGSEEEAYKIADYIKTRGLKTWIPVRRMCLSACTTIFLNGSEKIVDGLLGFHTGKFHIADPYQVHDLETAQKTIQKAMYENDVFMLKRIRLFLRLNVPLTLIEAMIEARGDFLIFRSMDEVLNFDKSKSYVKTLEEMSKISQAQPAKNFDFQGYEQLY